MKHTLLKRVSILFSLMLALSFSMQAQQHRTCGTLEADAMLRANHPEMGTYQDMVKLINKRTAEVAKNGSAFAKMVPTLPIVFHIIHDAETVGMGNNIAANFVDAQIAQLNIDFSNGAGSTNPVAANAGIQFVAAMQTPNGGSMAEAGINRIDRNALGWTWPALGHDQMYVNDNIKPNSQWDPTRYLNMWVLPLDNGTLGYAQFPDNVEAGGTANTDGVVVIPTSVGSAAVNNPDGGNYNAGRTATHEIGHWLGLLHIWGDGDCTMDDMVADTPAAGAPNYNCPTGTNSCTADALDDMIENYMDYTDDSCMNILTAGQAERIQASLASPRRGILASSNAGMPPTLAIPTMGQWSLFILALLFSTVGLVFLGYKRDANELA